MTKHESAHTWMLSIVAGLASIMSAGSSQAGVVLDIDFEGGDHPYTLGADGGATTILTTTQSHSAAQSVQFGLPNTQDDFSKVIINLDASEFVKLGDSEGSFWTMVDDSSPSGAGIPYMYFGVDTNNNGIFDFGGVNGGDSFVISFITTLPQDYGYGSWVQSGINGGTAVHVVGNRTGLDPAEFSSSNSPQGTLSSLATKSAGNLSWGDLNILQVRVGAGETGSPLAGYTAFVDDINFGSTDVLATPEPSTIASAASAVPFGLALWLKRRRKAPAA